MRVRSGLGLSEEGQGAVGVGGGDEEGYRARVADAERMHGLDELPAHHRWDAVTIEQRAHYESLGLVPAAAHLDEGRSSGLSRRRPLREWDDLAPAYHREALYHS